MATVSLAAVSLPARQIIATATESKSLLLSASIATCCDDCALLDRDDLAAAAATLFFGTADAAKVGQSTFRCPTWPQL